MEEEKKETAGVPTQSKENNPPLRKKKRRFATKIENGYYKFVEKEGQFMKGLLNYDGYIEDKKGNIIPGKSEKYFLGGIRIFSLNILNYIAEKEFDWTSVDEAGNPKRHIERMVDYIYLIPDNYYSEIIGAKEAGLLTLPKIRVSYTLRVKNPKKARYGCNHWVRMALTILDPAIRDFIGERSIDDITKAPGDLGDEIMVEMKKEKILDELDKYGIELLKVWIIQIVTPPEWQDALAAKLKAKKEAEAAIEEAEGIRQSKIKVAEGNKVAAILYKDGERAMVDMLIEKFGKEEAAAIYQTALLTTSSLAVDLKSEHIRGLGDFSKAVKDAIEKR